MSPNPPPENATAPGDDALPLPAFLSRRPEGLYLDPARLGGEAGFMRFVERLFLSGQRFAGLDYGLFQRLLYPLDEPMPAGPQRLADAVAAFEPERRALYKAVKIGPKGEQAEYFFEPVSLEAAGPDGQTQTVPTRLDFDEFVADMWVKGVRFGIDAAAVRQVIEHGGTGRVAIAAMREATPGRDAGIEEITDALHRDDTPKVRSDGRLDLCQFANRFPQIACNAPILKKLPRALGRPGCTVAGNPIEPAALPKDLDLAALAGPGTRVESREDGEYIVAARDGFLDLDAASNQVSVTEKIIHREEISLRSTGDLRLTSDAFETLGDVQEGRVVEGRHMTFRGNVFGTLQSHGGDIVIMGNLVGGRAASPHGSVAIHGRASQAGVEAEGGEVRIKLAEGCSIVGSRVSVERAVNCEIIAETLEVGQMESCAVAARSLRVGATATRKEAENLLSVLVPDLSAFQHRREQLNEELAAAEAALAEKGQELDSLRQQPDLAKFLAFDARLRKGEIHLTMAQKEQLQQTVRRFAPALQKMRAIGAALQKLQADRERLREELRTVSGREAAAGRGAACSIQRIEGETLVRRLKLPTPEPSLDALLIKEIGGRLRQYDTNSAPLFSGDEGAFDWQFGQDSE